MSASSTKPESAKPASTKPKSTALGVIFLVVSLLLPVVGFAPNEALAQQTGEQPVVAELESAKQEIESAETDREQAMEQRIEGFMEGHWQRADRKKAELAIPILAILLIFGLPPIVLVFLIIGHFRNKTRMAELQAQTIARMVEAGVEVPLELLQGNSVKTTDAQQSLNSGLRNVGLGLGLAVCLTALISWQAGTIGLVLIGMGAAQIISARMAGKIGGVEG